jgi:hypothetical protein
LEARLALGGYASVLVDGREQQSLDITCFVPGAGKLGAAWETMTGHEERQKKYYELYHLGKKSSCKIVQTARKANEMFECNMSKVAEEFKDDAGRLQRIEDCYIKHQPICNRMCGLPEVERERAAPEGASRAPTTADQGQYKLLAATQNEDGVNQLHGSAGMGSAQAQEQEDSRESTSAATISVDELSALGPPPDDDSCGLFAMTPDSAERVNMCKQHQARMLQVTHTLPDGSKDDEIRGWKFWYLPSLGLVGDQQGFSESAFDEVLASLKALHTRENSCTGLHRERKLVSQVPSSFGFGHNMLDVLAQLSQSFSWGLGYEFISSTTSVWHFANNKFCTEQKLRGWDCYFENLTSCATTRDFQSSNRSLTKVALMDMDLPAFTLLRGYEAHGIMWAQAALMAFIWKPTVRLMKTGQIVERKRALGVTQEWIGIHVRHGDSTDKQQYYSWGQYLLVAKKVQNKYLSRPSKIYLATDDPAVAAACTGPTTKAAGFLCAVASGIDREVFSAGSDADGGWLENRMMGTDGAQTLNEAQMQNIAISAFVDWELLAECGFFIGDLSRAFFRVPLLLHMGRQRRVPPIVSIETGESWLQT